MRERMIARLIPKGSTIAEIGVFRGNFSAKLLEIVEPEKIYLVDPWENQEDPELEGSWYHADSAHDMNRIFERVSARFATELAAKKMEMVRGTSADLAAALPDETLDLSYIDGDHRFEGVLQDMETLAQKTKIGGIIMLDDHNLGKWWGDGVIRAVNVFLGGHAAEWRILRAVGNQVALRRIS